MIFSNPTEYALRALTELASKNKEGYVMLDEIIAGTGMPRDFLAKVFQRLVRGGILRSTKGRGGGFSLSRAPHQITLMHVVEVLDGPQVFDRCVVGMERCSDLTPCPQHDLYKPIRQRLKDYLNTTTLADLVASLRSKQAVLAAAQAQQSAPASPGAETDSAVSTPVASGSSPVRRDFKERIGT